jgi:hypothetical protein
VAPYYRFGHVTLGLVVRPRINHLPEFGSSWVSLPFAHLRAEALK